MNFAQVKQLAGNNVWYGEQKRIPHPFDEGIARAGLVLPDYSKDWGTDISPWDGLVDLWVTKSLGAKFVYIKAIDGTLQSKYFVENRQRAKDAGLLDGSYGWLYRNANVSCVAQAQAYNTLLNKYPVALIPAIDFEPTYWGGVRSDPTYSDLRIWATEWLRLGNPKARLYSAAYFMNPYGQIPSDLKDMFDLMWVAHYGVVNPLMPIGYQSGEWGVHQFASTGNATVISPNSVGKKEVDLNYSKAIVTPPPGGDMYYLATGNITMRAAASSSSVNAVLNGNAQYVYKDDVLETEAPASGFVKIKRLWRNRAWVQLPSVAYCGTAYLTATTFTPPPDPAPGLDINSLSVHTSLNLTFADGNGTVIGTKGAENVELT